MSAGPRTGPWRQGPGRAPDAREPGRPASRAEATERTSARHRIGIRELRQHASVYVDLAEKGYTVDITNRGRLVAQLVPVREPGSPLERLIAAGIIDRPRNRAASATSSPIHPPSSAPAGGGRLGRGRPEDRR